MGNELNATWENMPSLKQMSVEQLLDRIHFLQKQHDVLNADEWERDWASELAAANAELNKRTVII